MPDQTQGRALEDALDHYWDTVLAGTGALPSDLLDPELATAVRRAHALGKGASPSPAFASLLWEDLMQAQPNASVVAPWFDAPRHVRPVSVLSRWTLPSPRPMSPVAAVILLIVLIVGTAFVALYPLRQHERQLFPLVAPSGTPSPVPVWAAGTPGVTPPDAGPGGANTFTLLWKSTGGPDALSRPFGLGIDPTGNVWVSDAGNDRFQIFSPDGTYLETWGAPGSGEGEFEFYSRDSKYGTPYGGVAFDRDGNIYVLDTGNYRVQKFAPDRSFLLSWGTRGRDNGQFLGAIGIAVDSNGFVYVADETRADIQKFDLDGRFLTKFGGPTTDQGEIRVPGGPAVGPDGDVWVSDFSTGHIVRFSPDGTLRTSWGRTGNDEGELISPNGIAVDGMGRIYVADDGNNRLQIFTPDGQFLAGLDRPADDQPKFGDMVTVAVGNDGVVYVSDQIGVYAFRIFQGDQPG